MTGEQTKKVIAAFEAVGITDYAFHTDMMGNYYNNSNGIIKYNEADELVYNIRSPRRTGSVASSEGDLEVATAWCEDIHEVTVGGNYEQIDSLLNELGVTLSDSDTKLLVNIADKNYDIIPVTGDYVNAFHYLSKKQIEELSPEEKAKYEADLKAYEESKEKYIGKNQAASITVG